MGDARLPASSVTDRDAPAVELFCRRPRLGWDSWGKGYEIGVAS